MSSLAPVLSAHPTTKVALVTGASSGIGRATALALARAGHDVAIVARRKDRLEALAQEVQALGRRALVITADLVDATEAARIVDATVDHFGRLDVLVNNAGRSLQGFLDLTTDEQARRLFELNFFTVVTSTRAALPHLRRTKGVVVNVASVSGVTPMPLHAFYSASKHALIGFASSLDYELDGAVRVMSVCPGPVDTELPEAMDGMRFPEWLMRLSSGMMDSPETIARAIVRATKRRRSATIVPSLRSRLAIIGIGMGPLARAVVAIFIRRMRAQAFAPEQARLAA
jgi:short-subunit dehydrogenase